MQTRMILHVVGEAVVPFESKLIADGNARRAVDSDFAAPPEDVVEAEAEVKDKGPKLRGRDDFLQAKELAEEALGNDGPELVQRVLEFYGISPALDGKRSRA